MNISERHAGDIAILDVPDRIVFGAGEEDFKLAVNRALDAGRVKLIINMTGVPYVDSAGISQLVRAFVTTGKRGGGMRLLGLSKRVRELLHITRLLTVMEAFASEEEAVLSFAAK